MIIDDDAMITFRRKVILKQIFDRVSKSNMYRADVNYYYDKLIGDRPARWKHSTWEEECEFYANMWVWWLK